MTEYFQKKMTIGTVAGYCDQKPRDVTVNIRYECGKLAFDGSVAGIAAGQIVMGLRAYDIVPADGWTTEAIQWLFDMWERWHLNDMRAGTPRQEEVIRRYAVHGGNAYREAPHSYAKTHGYEDAYALHCAWLVIEGLLVDGGYRYGTAWLREEVPQEIVDALQVLPSPQYAALVQV
jgi:hypothetical protein